MSTSPRIEESFQRRRLFAVLIVGVVISTVMLIRGQVSDDSLHLLSRGWLLLNATNVLSTRV
jgi:hypothetical protein